MHFAPRRADLSAEASAAEALAKVEASAKADPRLKFKPTPFAAYVKFLGQTRSRAGGQGIRVRGVRQNPSLPSCRNSSCIRFVRGWPGEGMIQQKQAKEAKGDYPG